MVQVELTEHRATVDYNRDPAVRKMIHALKYDGKREHAEPLGLQLAATYQQSGWNATLIVAVSLSAARLRQRGYNQAAWLAEALSNAIQVPFHRETLRKIRDTRPQVGLKADRRAVNVAGAFVAEPELARDQEIVLIDDVFTTGATLRECAAVLLAAGAKIVWGLTVAGVISRPLKTTARQARHASIRVVTDRRYVPNYCYAQLVMPSCKTKSLGKLDLDSPTPLLDCVLSAGMQVATFGLDELMAMRDASKNYRT